VTSAGERTRAILLTSVTMVAFAGNSLLCRLALRDASIDPASFTSIRLLSGALTLLFIVMLTRRRHALRQNGGWMSSVVLVFYAITFSYAYVSLSAGAGALILFGCVQGTMIAVGLWRGDRPGGLEWLGWLLAFGGMTWLVLPGSEAPPAGGALLMAAAGVGWGLYSLRGQSESDPVASNATNFLLSIVFIAVLTGLTWSTAELTTRGIVIAIVAGSITTGIGYVIWYAALDYLTAMQAALVQLSVPAIATAGGVLMLSEPLSLRMIASSTLVLGGICIALVTRQRTA
jgi:drug/metabolite transporter (DMT)-like permease